MSNPDNDFETEESVSLRRTVYTMKRAGAELKNPGYKLVVSIMDGASELKDLIHSVQVKAKEFQTRSDEAASPLVDAANTMLSEAKAIRKNAIRLAKLNQSEDGLVRYGLVAPTRGRDTSVGRIANRWIECGLDACVVHLMMEGGALRESPLTAFLEASFGERRDWLPVLIEGWLESVPTELVQREAERFLHAFASGKTDELAFYLRDDALGVIKEELRNFGAAAAIHEGGVIDERPGEDQDSFLNRVFVERMQRDDRKLKSGLKPALIYDKWPLRQFELSDFGNNWEEGPFAQGYKDSLLDAFQDRVEKLRQQLQEG